MDYTSFKKNTIAIVHSSCKHAIPTNTCVYFLDRANMRVKDHLRETSFTNGTETTPLISGTTNGTYAGVRTDKDKKKAENTKGGPSLFKVLVKCFGLQLFKGWMCKLMYDFLQFVNPMILR